MSLKDYLKEKGYQLLRQIGKGAFARVFKALRLKDELDVAIKAIPVSSLSPSKLQNCLDEVRIICRIDHPYIVKHFESFYDPVGKLLFIVMEHLAGGDLARHIQRVKDDEQKFSESQIWRWTLQAFIGMRYLHHFSVVHRDIKPANLFLTKDLKNIKIGDLNTCKIISKSKLSRSMIGTPNYLAPEVWGKKGYDQRCDVFSMGCVIYEIAAMTKTFPGNSLEDISKKIRGGLYNPLSSTYSKELNILISCCLIHKYKKRPSFKDLLETKVLKEKIKKIPDLKVGLSKTSLVEWAQIKTPSNLVEFQQIFEEIQREVKSQKIPKISKPMLNIISRQNVSNMRSKYRKSSTLDVNLSPSRKQEKKKSSADHKKSNINIYDDPQEDMLLFPPNNSNNFQLSRHTNDKRKIRSEFNNLEVKSKKSDNERFKNPLNVGMRNKMEEGSRRQLYNFIFPTQNKKSWNAKSQGKASETNTSMISNPKSIKSFGRLKSSNSPDKAVIYYNMYQEHLAKSRSKSRKQWSQMSSSRDKNAENYLKVKNINEVSTELSQKNMNGKKYRRKTDQERSRKSPQGQGSRSKKKLPLPFLNVFPQISENEKSNSRNISSYTGVKLKNEFSLPSPSEKSNKSKEKTNKLFLNQYYNSKSRTPQSIFTV